MARTSDRPRILVAVNGAASPWQRLSLLGTWTECGRRRGLSGEPQSRQQVYSGRGSTADALWRRQSNDAREDGSSGRHRALLDFCMPSQSPVALREAASCLRRRTVRAADERRKTVDLRSNWPAWAMFNTDERLRSGLVPHRPRHSLPASRAVWVRCVPAPKPISRHLRFRRP
jgi:hypothetical protein